MQKGQMPIFILVGILVIAVIAGAFYLGNQRFWPLTKSPVITPTPQPSCRPRPACLDAQPPCLIYETSDMCPRSVDETVNWKIYINQRFGFSMKYPKDWIVKENGNNSIWVSNTNDETLIIGVKNATDTVKITKSGTVVTKDLTKRGSVDFLQQPIEKDVLVFNGNDMSVMYDQAREISRGNLVFALSLDKTIVCPASINVPCPKILSPTSESIADKILSTFKFLK